MIPSLAYRSSLAGYDARDSVRAIALYMAFVLRGAYIQRRCRCQSLSV